MCKNKKKKEEERLKEGLTAQQPVNSGAVTKAFIFISVVFTLAMVFLVVWPITHKSKDVRIIQVALRIPSDSISVGRVLQENDAQIFKLIEELNKQSQEITDKYNVLLKSQETESDFFRLVSCIAAFVVALFGFLGYKTIKDIESKAQSVAKEQADNTAAQYVSGHLEQEVESQLKDIVGDTTAAKLLKEQLLTQLIPQLITPLENRINSLESGKTQPAPDEAPSEAPPAGAFAHEDETTIANLTQNEKGGDDHE